MPVTSVTLVNELRFHHDKVVYEQAWVRFTRQYSPAIFHWFQRACRLGAEVAEEVTQAFHVQLVNSIRDFEYDPGESFRGCLRVCVRNFLYSFLRDNKKLLHLGDGSDWLVAAETFDQKLQRLFDLELWETARQRVSEQVSARDWAVYLAAIEDDEDDSAVAARFQISVGAVYTIKWRLKKKLAAEVQQLELGGSCAADASTRDSDTGM